jgi:hypothetical protein
MSGWEDLVMFLRKAELQAKAEGNTLLAADWIAHAVSGLTITQAFSAPQSTGGYGLDAVTRRRGKGPLASLPPPPMRPAHGCRSAIDAGLPKPAIRPRRGISCPATTTLQDIPDLARGQVSSFSPVGVSMSAR